MSFVRSFCSQKNKSNFVFICDHCLTIRENAEASTLQEQITQVVSAVARLTKEVSELKKSKQDDVAPKNVCAETVKTVETKSAWNDLTRTNKMK